MQNLILSLNKNILRITTVDKTGLKYVKSEVSEHIASDYKILDLDQFTDIVKDLVPSLTSTPASKLSLDILAPPEEVLTLYVTAGKDVEDIESHIINEVRQKLDAEDLEGLYFSYEKIAPFVYQFVGVRKENLQAYIDLSNMLGISLRTVIPWVMLLPKFVETNDPAIFIANNHGDQVVALSELNGIFFSTTYENEQDPESLQQLVQKLSVYKRSDPITKIYKLNYEHIDFDDKYHETDIEVPNADFMEEKGYELNLIANYMLDSRPDLVFSQLNVLNYLPVPIVVNKKSNALVYVGGVVGVLIIVGGIAFGLSRLTGNESAGDDLAQNPNDETSVLSENSEPNQEQQQNEQQPPQEETPQVELNRADLSIRVENGAGIPGIAGRTQERLEGFGYQVSGVGNAAELGREDTLLRFKPNNAQYAPLLEEDLQNIYQTITIQEDLPEDAEYDVLMIVGTDVTE